MLQTILSLQRRVFPLNCYACLFQLRHENFSHSQQRSQGQRVVETRKLSERHLECLQGVLHFSLGYHAVAVKTLKVEKVLREVSYREFWQAVPLNVVLVLIRAYLIELPLNVDEKLAQLTLSML